MFNLFKTEPLKTFDDVASNRAKSAREFIFKAADEALIAAANCAANGDDAMARYELDRYGSLKWLAIAIPLDMVERGL
jgi:hypothetical protein